MARLYTRTGDHGETALLGGVRLPKDDVRFDVIGTLDELNAQLGVVRAALVPTDSLQTLMESLQADLFTIGAYLAEPEPTTATPPTTEARVAELEAEIDAVSARVPALRCFILPGGSEAGARLHLARTVARRAERELLRLSNTLDFNRITLRYLNRLSDLLFATARVANTQAGAAETTWQGQP